MTVHDRVAAARTRLRAAGLGQAEAELGARLLAQFVLGWDAARFATFADREEPLGFHADYQALGSKRIAREPLAYITGTREFWGLEFAVSPAVLIPRPETELIVETMLKRYPDRDRRLDVVDVGTGSGCLAIALARERPQWRIAAVDISDDALQLAREHAARF